MPLVLGIDLRYILAPEGLKAGDKVLFTSYGGTEVKVDGEEYLLMSEEDILAVVP